MHQVLKGFLKLKAADITPLIARIMKVVQSYKRLITLQHLHNSSNENNYLMLVEGNAGRNRRDLMWSLGKVGMVRPWLERISSELPKITPPHFMTFPLAIAR